MDIRILDGFMNISASSNCPQIPSNTPLLKEKKNNKTSHHRTKQKAEVWRFCSFGDYFSSTSHSWKHCLCEHSGTRDMISSSALPDLALSSSLHQGCSCQGRQRFCAASCIAPLCSLLQLTPGQWGTELTPPFLLKGFCLHLSDIRYWLSFLSSGSNFPISFAKFPSAHDL